MDMGSILNSICVSFWHSLFAHLPPTRVPKISPFSADSFRRGFWHAPLTPLHLSFQRLSLRFQHTLDLLASSRHTSTHFTRYAYRQPQIIHPLRYLGMGARPAHASIRFNGKSREQRRHGLRSSKEGSWSFRVHYE